jgi:hypothetical protein
MSEYAGRFAENGIDIAALRHLTDQDLKDIGVLLGHRRKMLAAIGELTGAAPAPLGPTTATEPKTQDTAERRPQIRQHVICGAVEFERADAHSPIYPAYQCLFKEGRKPRAFRRTIRDVLQLRSHP